MSTPHSADPADPTTASAQSEHPVAAEPAASEPHASEPHASEPHASEPHASEPRASDPDAAEEPREPIVTETEREVVLQRSVRFGRILLVGAIVGAVLGVAVSLAFPVAEDAEYTMNQVIGFMVFIGAAAGFLAAALLSLILSIVARRNRGTGVAIQADVR